MNSRVFSLRIVSLSFFMKMLFFELKSHNSRNWFSSLFLKYLSSFPFLILPKQMEATSTGRILMAGHDGCLYELDYQPHAGFHSFSLFSLSLSLLSLFSLLSLLSLSLPLSLSLHSLFSPFFSRMVFKQMPQNQPLILSPLLPLSRRPIISKVMVLSRPYCRHCCGSGVEFGLCFDPKFFNFCL